MKRCKTTKIFSVGALGERAVQCSDEVGHPWPCEKWADVHPAQWCQVQQPLGWQCTRPGPHDGPCASVQVAKSGSHDMTIEDVELCEATTTWGGSSAGQWKVMPVQCLLGKGHDGPHSGAVSWT